MSPKPDPDASKSIQSAAAFYGSISAVVNWRSEARRCRGGRRSGSYRWAPMSRVNAACAAATAIRC